MSIYTQIVHTYKAPFGDIPELRAHLIPRWCVVKTTRNQSVAEHSYNVAVIARKLCKMLGLNEAETNANIAEALLHDSDEVYTGDIPSPAKIHVAVDGDSVTTTKNPIIKLADYIEAFVFIRDNHCDTEIVHRWVDYNLREAINEYAKKLNMSEQVITLLGRISL